MTRRQTQNTFVGLLPAATMTAAAAYFLLCAFVHISGQGLFKDALTHGFWASDIITRAYALLSGQRIETETFSLYLPDFLFLRWPGRPDVFFPVMTCYFTGAPIIYLIVPFVLLLGQTTLALTTPFILLSLLSALLIHYVCRAVFGRTTALALFVLLCTSQFFIRISRIGAETETGLQIFLLWLGLAALTKHARHGKRSFLFAAGLSFGFALYAKLMFAAYVCGAIVVLALTSPALRRGLLAQTFARRKDVAVFASAIIAGMLPIASYFLFSTTPTNMETYMRLKTQAPGAASGLVHSAALRAEQLIDIARNNFHGIDSVAGQDHAALSVLGLLCMLFALVHAVLTKKTRRDSEIILLVSAFYATVFLTSVLSPASLKANHLGLLLPFPYILKARCAGLAFEKRRGFTLLLLPLLAGVAANAYGTGRFLRRIETRMDNPHSVALFHAADWPKAFDYIAAKRASHVMADPELLGCFYGRLLFRQTAALHERLFHPAYPRFEYVNILAGNPEFFDNTNRILVLATKDSPLSLVAEHAAANMHADDNFPFRDAMDLYEIDLWAIFDKRQWFDRTIDGCTPHIMKCESAPEK